MAQLILSIALMLLGTYGQYTLSAVSSAKNSRLVSLEEGQAVIVEALENYFYEFNQWPASLQALGATPGYEHIRRFLPRSQGGSYPGVTSPWRYALSSTYTTADAQEQRVGVFIDGRNPTVNFNTYLATNLCGNGAPFSTAQVWCGSSDFRYVLLNTGRVRVAKERVAAQQQRLSAEKFIQRWRTQASLPAVATATALRSLVSPAGTGANVGTSLATCTGSFYWQNMPFECQDLYNQYGNPVSYLRLTANSFELRSQSVFRDNAGNLKSIVTTVTL
ncbi:MAG: hypothetical protein P3W96_006325 [Halomonas sp.]|nr:hypothetical protein [Halomonas sp.]MDM7481618.1 hypothetical protein [Halomonas sp.]